MFPKGPPREFGLLVHMTLGQSVLALLLVRLLWRQINPPPPPETTPFGRLIEIAAKASHFTLYGLLLVVPLLGVIVQLKRGNELPIFAIWHVPSPWPVDRSLARSILSLHGTLADALLILAGIPCLRRAGASLDLARPHAVAHAAVDAIGAATRPPARGSAG